MAEYFTQWAVVDTQTNATATATHAGVSGQQHYITSVSVSASAAPATAVTCTITGGSDTLDEFLIPPGAFSPIVINYDHPLRVDEGDDAEITVAALGSGVVGKVVIRGFTKYSG